MKKSLCFIFAVLLSVSAVFAKGGMPADVKRVTDRLAKITGEYYKSLGKVKSAKELARVIDRYSSELEKLAPQIKSLESKYGNADAGDDSSSEEGMDDSSDFGAVQDEWAKQFAGSEMSDSMVKIQKYFADPAVQKSMEKLNRVLEDIGISDDEGDNDRGNEDYGSGDNDDSETDEDE